MRGLQAKFWYEKSIAHVSAISLLPVFEKWGIFSAFLAILHIIDPREGGNTVLRHGKARRRTMDESMTCGSL